jgi:hypothetical protein
MPYLIMKLFFALLITLVFSNGLFAQVNPPQLSCIEGNGSEIEIFWSAPINPCNTVNGYEVFFSDQIDGPYQSFTITNTSAIDTTFATIFTEVYCFMQSIMPCPGETVLSSDTLIWDLRPPTVASISVNSGNQIEVTWEPNTSPDISAYLIYIDNGNIPDTVYGVESTVYTDLISNPATASHNYQIAWFRDCVNDGDRRGSIGAVYNSILMQDLDQDLCNRAFSFGWNNYENYTDGILGYQISVSENSGAYVPIDTVPTNQLIYLFTEAVNEVFYCFKVAAVLPNGLLGASNTLCDTARVIDIPMGAHVRNASVVGPNTVHIEYFPDISGDIADLNPQRSESGTNFQTWPVGFLAASGTNPNYDIYEDNTAAPASSDYFYRFRRVDECGDEHFSDTVRTIQLAAELGFGLVGELEWNPFEITYGTVVEYTIIKYVNGDSSVLTTVGASTLSFEDNDAIDPSTLDTVCYQIIAEIELVIPDLISTTVFSNSNVSCLEPTPRIFMPNAFKPTGLNNVFKPIFHFGTDENYIFRVYNRIGQQLFETNNPAEGWDGRVDGKLQGLEGFVYYVSFVGQDGETYTKSGSFVLMH